MTKFGWPDPQAYPAPGYEGSYIGGVTVTPRRFWIGPVFNDNLDDPPGEWVDIQEAVGYGNIGTEIASLDPNAATYIDLVTGATVGVGQSFDSGAGGKLVMAAFYFGSAANQQQAWPTGPTLMKIYEHAGTYGTDSVPGALLATSDEYTEDYGPWWIQWQTFQFSGAEQITLAPSTKYIAVVENRSGNVTNNKYWKVMYRAAGAHAGNAMTLDDVTETWTPDATKDIPFSVICNPVEFIPGEALTFSNGATGHLNKLLMYVFSGYGAAPNRYEIYCHISSGDPLGLGGTITGQESGATTTITSSMSFWHDYVYTNNVLPWDADWPDSDDGTPVEVNTDDPLNSYMDVVVDTWEFEDPPALPGLQTGCEVCDNQWGQSWTVVLPYDAEARAFYLYPDPPLPTTKIYYDKNDFIGDGWYAPWTWTPEIAGAGSVPYEVSPDDPNVVFGDWFTAGKLGLQYGYSIVTEVGEDATGTWIKIRPVLATDPFHTLGADWEQVRVCAATYLNIGWLSGGSYHPSLVILPWGPRVPGSFDEAREEFIGQSPLSIYLSEEVDAFEVFSMLNAAVASYLFNDHLGKYRYVAYMPPAGATLPQFTESDIFSFSEDVDASEIISRVKAKFQHRVTQDYWQVRFVERPEAQYLQRSPVPILKEVEFPFVKAADGLKGGQRTALMEGVPQRVYKTRVSSKAWTLLPSDFIQITYSRHGINGVFEILETKRDLKTGQVDLVVGGLRGITGGGLSGGFGYPGHWCEEAPVFPASLGSGDASVWDPAWTPEQKAYAKQNFGYWSDEDGFADPTDPESFNASTWI